MPQDLTPPLDFPWADPPAPGATITVAPGVHWVRMPLPFRLNHINLWLLDDGARTTVVDCGYGLAETRDHWRAILETRPPARVLVTHFHPDHMGNAGWLSETYGAEVATTESEWLWANYARWVDPVGELDSRIAFYRAHGLDEDRLAQLRNRGNWYPQGVPTLPHHYRRLRDGDEEMIGGRSWRVIVGRGHAPEQALLHCAELDLLIAGDQVLPKITPNVAVQHVEPMADPLDQFLRTLDRLHYLPDDTLVLPSHGMPFRGLQARLDAMRQHHDERLAEVLAACAEPQTTLDIVGVLFRRDLDVHQLGFAMGEALAHLRFLETAGRLARAVGDDGVVRFHAAA
ncbi:MAG: MBL fold metallo-hydrolase [Alphaproteobacteria bacterium]|nr:MBL fold metallo-hydrolase [Alphaproteobacteria bacterium]